MYVLRPISQQDFSALKEISIESGPGFTSLPVDDDLLRSKIDNAQKMLTEADDNLAEKEYIFVLEQTDNQQIIGVTGIKTNVGSHLPLYHYRLEQDTHCCEHLNIHNQTQVLKVCNDYIGATEVCTLYLRSAFRKGYAGRFMPRIRFLFMANHPQLFSSKVIAEMRGVSDTQGHAPFWDGLPAHFFMTDFSTASHLRGIGQIEFIESLMPKHPIYTCLLNEKARTVIGQVHPNTMPALKLLEKEGFCFKGYVDLFDAGPTVEAQLKHIHSVNNSTLSKVKIAQVKGDTTFAICNLHIKQFRAVFSNNAEFESENNCLLITEQLATKLSVKSGDTVRFIDL
ncbi:MAG: arginine N-succinyltransferase [Paraglaciecola sp.]|nr:arginine N-succinyltransferase [Paraglaciecola sp.]